MFKTGDPLIDKWEEEVAAGLTPDLFEGLPQQYRDKWKRNQSLQQKVITRAQEELVDLEGFSETY